MTTQGSLPTSVKLEIAWVYIAWLLIAFLGFAFNTNFVVDQWQYLDILALRTELWESIYYLHSQPPFLNVLLGLSLKLLLAKHAIFLTLIYYLFVFANIWCGAHLAQRLRIPRGLVYVFFFTPQVFLYANFFYTPLILFTFFNFLMYSLLCQQGQAQLFGAGVASALLSLTHAVFVPLAVFIVFLAWAWSFHRGILTRGRLAICLLIFAVPVGLQVKNIVVFGVPTLSSWGGCNLASRTYAPIMSLFNTDGFVRGDGPKVLYAPKKVKGAPNLNHIDMIDRCEVALHKSLAWIAENPARYAEDIVSSIAERESVFTFDYSLLLDKNRVLHGLLAERWTLTFSMIFGWLRGPPILVITFAAPLLFLCLSDARSRRGVALLCALYYGLLFANHAVNWAEQHRMAFRTSLFLYLSAIFVLQTGLSRAVAAVAQLRSRHRARQEMDPPASP